MPETTTLALFLVAAFLLLVTPGPAVSYIVARSVSQGRTAGLVSCLGIGLGGLLHVAAAAAGLSAVVASSALAFGILKYAGAAYLVWLGIRSLRDGTTEDGGPVAPQSLRRVFWEGAVVNALNPKAALFFLAFLPQFVDPSRAVLPQVLFLGLLFMGLAVTTDSLYALLSGTAADWLRRRGTSFSLGRYFAAFTYLALGCATALSGFRT